MWVKERMKVTTSKRRAEEQEEVSVSECVCVLSSPLVRAVTQDVEGRE